MISARKPVLPLAYRAVNATIEPDKAILLTAATCTWLPVISARKPGTPGASGGAATELPKRSAARTTNTAHRPLRAAARPSPAAVLVRASTSAGATCALLWIDR